MGNGDRWIVIDDGSVVCENRELPTEKKPRAGELSPTSTVYPSEEEIEEPEPPTTDKKRPERTREIRVSDYPESVTIEVIRKLLAVFEPKFFKTHEAYEERLNQQSPAECQHILSRDLGLLQKHYRINPEVIQEMFEQSRLERSEQSSRAGDSIKDRKSKRDRDPRLKKRRRRKSSAPAAKSQGGYDPDAHERQAKKNRSRPSAPAAVKEEIKEEDDSSASKCSVKSSDFCDTDWRTNPKKKKRRGSPSSEHRSDEEVPYKGYSSKQYKVRHSSSL